MTVAKIALFPLAMTIIFNAASQVLIRRGVAGASIEMSWQGLKFLALNGWVLGGLAAQTVAVFYWLRVLSIVNLSVALPIFTSILFLLVLTISLLVLGERISLVQGGGIVLIIIGITLLTRG